MNTIDSLANCMLEKVKNAKDPYVLLLGAGASISSGCHKEADIARNILRNDLSLDLSEGIVLVQYYDYMRNLNHQQRYHKLKPYIEGKEPCEGYKRLAELIKWGFFETIITTNFDVLLEHALEDAGLHNKEDYITQVLYHDLSSDEAEKKIDAFESKGQPPVKILKVHGDLYERVFDIAPSETSGFDEIIEERLRQTLKQDIIIIGYGMLDLDVINCFHGEGQEFWFVNPEAPEGITLKVMGARKNSDYINSCFDDFFNELWKSLNPSSQDDITEWRYGYGTKFYEAGIMLQKSIAPQSSDDYLDRAVYEFRKAIRFATQNNQDKDVYYYSLGKAHSAQKHINDAISCYSESIRINPNSAQAYFERSLKRGEMNDAENKRESMWDLWKARKLGWDEAENYYLSLIRTYISHSGKITNSKFQELFYVNTYIASRALQRLVEEGEILREKRAGKIYYISPGEGIQHGT